MAKMYYSEQEAADKLKISVAELANYVRDGKLRSYQDGAKKMFKSDEVDALTSGGTAEIELAPADTSAGISLSEADKPKPTGKEDTVITAEGISIFDDEDLEIEAADPMAKTQIAPTLEDQVSIEGVGSGSGLLDLTRESDDTSLGAEVLENIDMEGQVGSSLGGEEITSPLAEGAAPEAAGIMPTYVEVVDAASGAFNGLIIGCAVVMLFIGAVALSSLADVAPGFVVGMRDNLILSLVGAVVVVAAGAVIGYLMGKSAAQRQAALQRVS